MSHGKFWSKYRTVYVNTFKNNYIINETHQCTWIIGIAAEQPCSVKGVTICKNLAALPGKIRQLTTMGMLYCVRLLCPPLIPMIREWRRLLYRPWERRRDGFFKGRFRHAKRESFSWELLQMLKVHKRENFWAPIFNFELFLGFVMLKY
jgi:hypothetical protein